MTRRKTVHPNLFKLFFALFVLLATGTVFYANAEGWSYFDSLYFSLTTLTTVGYGDIYPTHHISKVFTMFYILFGVGMMFYALSTITQTIIESQRKMMHKAEELTHKIQEEEQGIVVTITENN